MLVWCAQEMLLHTPYYADVVLAKEGIMVRSKLVQIRQAVYEKYHPLTTGVALECLGLAVLKQ